MREKLSFVPKYGISSDTLKIIAVLAMVIDHIAYYFYNILPKIAIDIMKYGIGRIAMPIFVYLLVQGFFNTKNFNKYLIRMSAFAIATQLVLFLGSVINKNMFSDYVINIHTIGNILISFAITLVILKIIHEPIILKKYDEKQNIIIKVIIVFLLLGIYICFPIDYGTTVPIMSILFYAIERFRLTVLISQNNVQYTFKGFIYMNLDQATIKKVYNGLILMSLLVCIMFCGVHWPALFAIIPIYLYNGERLKKYNKYKYTFYLFFPLHHFIMYLAAMYVTQYLL